MTDDRQDRGPRDRSRINLNEEWEVEWWARTWEVTPEQLRDAIKKVGVSTQAVASCLGKKVTL